MRIPLIILSLILAFNAFAQRADSLIDLLKAQEANDTNKVLLLNSIGRALAKEGRLVESKSYFNKVIPIADSLGFKFGQAQSYNWMAITLRESGEFVNAVTFQLKSLVYYNELRDTFGISRGYLTLANIYLSMDDSKAALGYFLPALKLSMAIKNEAMIASCQGNMAICFNALMQLDSAEKYYLKAINYYIKINSFKDLAEQYGNIGLLKLDQNLPEKSLWYLKQAFEYYSKINDEPGMATAYNNIGEVYFFKKNYKQALIYFEKGYHLTLKEENKSAVISALLSLANCYQIMGDYKNAYFYLKQHLVLRDSALNATNARTIAEMNARFDSEKREQEITLLNKDKEIQATLYAEGHKRKNIVLWLVGIGLLLVIIFSAFLFNRFKITQKQKNIIESQKTIVEQKKEEIEKQKELVEEKQKEILDSIKYARRIQSSLMTSEKYIARILSNLKTLD